MLLCRNWKHRSTSRCGGNCSAHHKAAIHGEPLHPAVQEETSTGSKMGLARIKEIPQIQFFLIWMIQYWLIKFRHWSFNICLFLWMREAWVSSGHPLVVRTTRSGHKNMSRVSPLKAKTSIKAAVRIAFWILKLQDREEPDKRKARCAKWRWNILEIWTNFRNHLTRHQPDTQSAKKSQI